MYTGPFENLSEDDCWRLLAGQPVGRLAVSVGGRPDIFPLNYVVADSAVIFRTAAGAKLASVVINAAVAFETDGYDAATGQAWSVVVHGHAERVPAGEESDILEGLPLVPWNSAPKNNLVRIVSSEISGRSFLATGRPADA